MIRRIKIPDDRIAVLIGRSGKTRRYLENKTKTKITIEDDVHIEGESLDVIGAENIVKAISRGFSPKNAFALLHEDTTMAIIDLPKNADKLKRIRSRLIGTKGKCRRTLEVLTKTKISIYGRTVGIIGSYESIKLAEDAINRLITGISHNNVYAYLEGRKSNIS